MVVGLDDPVIDQHVVAENDLVSMALALGEYLGRARFEMKEARSRLLVEFLIWEGREYFRSWQYQKR
jgi:hypothetical protein